MDDPGEWVTIAEAARRLGVPERSLRRVVSRAPYADKTRQETRQTRTGTRQAVLVPSELFPDLARHFERWETRTEGGPANAAGIRQSPDSPTQTEGGLLTAYAKMLADKDAEIAFLREQLDKAQDNLSREQGLRALAPGAIKRPWWKALMFWEKG